MSCYECTVKLPGHIPLQVVFPYAAVAEEEEEEDEEEEVKDGSEGSSSSSRKKSKRKMAAEAEATLHPHDGTLDISVAVDPSSYALSADPGSRPWYIAFSILKTYPSYFKMKAINREQNNKRAQKMREYFFSFVFLCLIFPHRLCHFLIQLKIFPFTSHQAPSASFGRRRRRTQRQRLQQKQAHQQRRRGIRLHHSEQQQQQQQPQPD